MDIQNQIRRNASEINEYIKDLHSWTRQKNQEPPKPARVAESLPVRGSLAPTAPALNLKRDQTTIAEFYENWNKYDVVD